MGKSKMIWILCVVLSCVFMNNPVGAVIGTTLDALGRYEVFEISVRGTMIIKLDKFTGQTYELSGNIDREDVWQPIRNDEVTSSKHVSDGVSFQIFSSPSITILYNVHDGQTWVLTQGPTGYRLSWKKTK